MQKFCVICGAKLGQNNRFCPECGKPVAIDAPENIDPEITPAPAVSPAVAPCQKKWIKVTIAAIAALLLLGGIGVGGYFIFAHFSNKQTQKEETKSFSMTEQQENDPSYQEALELLKTADLSKPTLEMAKAAALTANIEILETIKKNGFSRWDDPGIIVSAAKYGSVALIEKLVSYGADINAKNNRGRTMLYSAAEGGNMELVKYLENKGLDIYAKDNSGATVLFYAALGGNLELVKYLENKGLDIYAKDNSGATVLHAAAMGNNVDIIRYFIKKNIDVNSKGYFNTTALHLAAYCNNFEAVKCLVENGADINAALSDGETPLIKAVQAECRGREKLGNLEMVKYLVENGADLTLTDRGGWTVLNFARKSSTQDIVDYLISQGAR